MESFSLAPVSSSPETLLDLCYRYISHNIYTICTTDKFTNDLKLKDHITLPSEICDTLITQYHDAGYELNDRFLNIFKNMNSTRLKRVRLRNSSISDECFQGILQHKLQELEMYNCNNITEASLSQLNDFGENLTSLTMGSSIALLPRHLINDFGSLSYGSKYILRGYILKTPKLKRLTAHHLLVDSSDRKYFSLLLRNLPKLYYLDLSGSTGLGNLSFLQSLQNLSILILHNAPNIQYGIEIICCLKHLIHLDISQSTDKHGTFKNENETLALLIENLPRLDHLDISGTNLAGTGVAEHSESLINKLGGSDIPGLSSRVKTPLSFLGLYGTPHGACRRHDIPALKISGDANEAQILTAAEAYIERPQVLQKVLNDLYHLFRYETCQQTSQALSVVLEAMDRHVSEKHIQISGSATLFYIVKSKDKLTSATMLKRKVIRTLLNGMSLHRSDDTMMRNGCLTLCQFKIPDDVLFDYKRLVEILLHIVYEMEQEGFVQRIGIYLLNSLACQVDGFQKQLLGDLGAIHRMLALIEDRLERKVCDDVLEVAWSTMWNVTDETPHNCQRFLDGRGMEFFLKCLNTFPDKEELLRNMMGLLGNVAEVQSLRPRLMTNQFVTVFADLLDSSSDGIEVSYNAAGVLSHMASDGPLLWTLHIPRREDVLNRMVQAIERWDLSTERNINYRSFEPILYLANIYHTPECQHWAIWALANLTSVYPGKYCLLVEAEGGMAILERILTHELPYPRIKELAQIVITNCQTYQDQYRRNTSLYDG